MGIWWKIKIKIGHHFWRPIFDDKKLCLWAQKGSTVFKIGNQTEIKSLQNLEANFHTFNMSTIKYSKRFFIWTRNFWKKSNFWIFSLIKLYKKSCFSVFWPFCANLRQLSPSWGYKACREKLFGLFEMCVAGCGKKFLFWPPSRDLNPGFSW